MTSLDIYRRIEEVLLWESQQSFASRADFEEFHDDVSLYEKLRTSVFPPWTVPLLVSGAAFLAGWGLSVYSNQAGLYWSLLFPKGFSITLVVALEGLLWFDYRGRTVVIALRDVFGDPDEEYYGLFGRMVELFYEPFPWAPRPEGRWLHRPTTLLYATGVVVYGLVLALKPELVGDVLLSLDWAGLSFGLKVYGTFVILTAGAVMTYAVWVVFVGTVFLGKRTQRLSVKLDVTKREFRLGMEPYANYFTQLVVLYLLAMTIIGILVIQAPSRIVIVGYGFITLLPIFGTLGGHYGFHKAVRESKRSQLELLGEEYGAEMENWFLDSERVDRDGDYHLEEFLEAKREIERLPDWSLNVQTLGEIALLVVVSNLSLFIKFVL